MKKHINRILSVILSLSLIYQPCTATGNNYSKIKNNISSLSNKKMSTKDKIAYYGLAIGALAISAGAILSYLDPKSSDSNTSNQQQPAIISDSISSQTISSPNKQTIQNKYSCSEYKIKEELDELGINNGLYNVGNSCYMNAMLQQLYSIDAFREWIINFSDNQHVSDIETLNKIEAMKSIFEYMSGEEKTDLEPLRSALGHTGKQEDSLECIQSKWSDIFDLFKQEKFKQYSAGDPDDDYLYSKQLYINSSCKISELLKSNKKYDSVKADKIKKGFKLSKEWLSKFEELWYDNELDYEKEFNTFCDQKNLVEKAETRKSLFPIDGQFMITLNRADYDSLNRPIKVNTSVEPNELLTSKNINEPGKNKKYKLTGIIIHSGKSCNGGHYYSYKFNAKDKKWYEYNDSCVTQVNYDDIRDNIYTNAVAFTYTDVDKLK